MPATKPFSYVTKVINMHFTCSLLYSRFSALEFFSNEHYDEPLLQKLLSLLKKPFITQNRFAFIFEAPLAMKGKYGLVTTSSPRNSPQHLLLQNRIHSTEQNRLASAL